MFGYITPNFNKLNSTEQNRYKAVYCGLCHKLKENYSELSRIMLSFDLTFLVLLLSSLYEPFETNNKCNCILQKGKTYKYINNKFINYCADMTIILAYHKLLDDVNDENKLSSKIAEKLITKHYNIIKDKMPSLIISIEKLMIKLNSLENNAKKYNYFDDKYFAYGDIMAKTFGLVLSKIFSPFDDVFKPTLQSIGANLGYFIYFMDAACDIKTDFQNENYNPYKNLFKNNIKNFNRKQALDIKNNLSVILGKATNYYEKLPLVQDNNILNNILYEGVWLKFNLAYLKSN